MSKGGQQTGSVQIPGWLENAAIGNINRASDVAQIGYTPYYGPDVAAFSPMQQQAMMATGGAAQAFGLAGPGFNPLAGIPQPQTYAGGIQGYSSAPLFEQSLDVFRQVRPGQSQAIESMFIDPYSGQYIGSNYAPTTQQLAQTTSQQIANQQAHELALAQLQAQQDHSTNINVDTSLTGGAMTYDTEQGPITINPEMVYNPAFDASVAGGTVTGGSMTMDQGPVTVQTEQGPVTVDPTMGFNPVFDPSYTGGSTNIDYSATTPDVVVSGLDTGPVEVGYYDDGGMTYLPYNNTDVIGSIGPEEALAAQTPTISDVIALARSGDQAGADALMAQIVGAGYSDPAEEALMSMPVVPATGTVHPMGAQPAMYAGGEVDIVGGAGLPPQDIGLMDVLSTATAVTPLNLGAALLTGSTLNPNTDPVPVVDKSTPTANLPAVVEPNIIGLASQNPGGTYDQAYWAAQVAAGVPQSEILAEQQTVLDAGGQLYAAVPNPNNNNSGSGSGGSSGGSSYTGGGTYCCTKMRENGVWTSPKRVYKMHKWHNKQPQWWRDGYDVWGKVVADNWLKKGHKFNAKLMNAFYEHRVNKGKLTAKSALAHAIMYPPVFAMGMISKLTGRHIKDVDITKAVEG